MSVDAPKSHPPRTHLPGDEPPAGTDRSAETAGPDRSAESAGADPSAGFAGAAPQGETSPPARLHVRDLLDRGLQARDGSVGRVQDVLFDDERWEVIYLVVHAGAPVFGRDVLVSPEAVAALPAAGEPLAVHLSREQVKESPGRALAPPVSEQVRADPDPDSYAGWPAHGHDPHLRSAREVLGYRFRTRDGEVGRVADLVLEPHAGRWHLPAVQVAPQEGEVQQAVDGAAPVTVATDAIERTRWSTHDMRAGQKWL
jgi:sporulation protein YlmC with PRC-barrel domain